MTGYAPDPSPDSPTAALERVAQAYRDALAHGTTQELSLTGLDRTGVPVVATTWRGTLADGTAYDAHGVGYGESGAAAAVGAWGELAERVLLAPVVRALEPRVASYRELVAEVGEGGVADPLTLALEAGTAHDHDRPLTWVTATRWRTGEPVLVPVELVASDAAGLSAFAPADPARGWLVTPITNGMGAGDTVERAVGHALMEVLQRDGDTVSFRALDQGVVIDVDASEDPATVAVLATLRAAGLHPVVKLAATEPVPVVYAVARDTDPEADPMALSAVGEAAHPDLDEAIAKALLELASSRARRVFAFGPVADVERLHPDYLADDLSRPVGPDEPRALAATAAWSRLTPAAARAVLEPVFFRTTAVVDPADLRATLPAPGAGVDLDDPASLLTHLLGLLPDHDVLVVTTPPGSRMHAAKVVVPGLEVETMSYLRIGERVAARLLERQERAEQEGRGVPVLVGRGAPDRPGRLPVLLTEAARARLGGPVWIDRDVAEEVVGPLYALYREPRRHALARAAGGPATQAVDALRRSQDRDLSQEGIPMYLALVDSRPAATGPVAGANAPREDAVAGRLEALREALAPRQRDDDLGVTATLLAAGAWADVGSGAAARPGGLDDAARRGSRLLDQRGSRVLDQRGSQLLDPRDGPRDPREERTWGAHLDAIAGGSVLRVVNFHNTVASGRDRLRAELAAYQERFTGLTLDDLDAFFETGRWPEAVTATGRPGFVPVFYEGYANHAAVAAPVCEELGLTGWFAVVTGFVGCPVEEQELFARSHWIGLAPEELDGRRLAMTWDEVADLSTRHVVHPHTHGHEGIETTVSEADLEREVHDAKRRLDACTGQDSASVSWLGGTPHGASERHDAAVRAAGHRYVISNTMVQRIG